MTTKKKAKSSITKLPRAEFDDVRVTWEDKLESPHPIVAKLEKASLRFVPDHEKVVLARLALKAIAEGPRSDLRDIAVAALKVVQ